MALSLQSMDIYTRRSRWKFYFLIAGIVIVLITIFYSGYLANKLAENERNKVILYAKAMESIYEKSVDEDVQFEADILEKYNNIPVIMENEEGVFTPVNFTREHPQSYFQRRKEKFLASGKTPVETIGYARYIYFENSRLYRLITLFPLVQVILLGCFVGLGYLGFSSSRRAEQNRVWAGMAKETAHQLGTPISAIIAWIEHLKSASEGDEEQLEIIGELRNDVKRLELIADRFSKIGSTPKLEAYNLVDEIQVAFKYMERRASRKVSFEISYDESILYAALNQHLFAWVVENIIRNSLDSMDGEGKISAHLYTDNNMVCVDLSDTGKGIPSSKFKTVFQPGYSTKKRGWGLGLSLAKRIIDIYHNGKILVKNSKIDEGTTFTIRLPKVVA